MANSINYIFPIRDIPGPAPTALKFNMLDAAMIDLNTRKNFYGAMIYKTSSQSITTGQITFQAKDYDTTSTTLWSAGTPNRLIVPSGISRIRLKASIHFSSPVTAGVVQLQFGKDGSALGYALGNGGSGSLQTLDQADSNGIHAMSISINCLSVIATDYFTLEIAGPGSMTINANDKTWFAIECLG